ncbi:metallophosphoesterase [Halobacterium rubrum]|uniref:metallophosphoesterase n=1 Tax=Halobacterium TaxID=2239 RepID=UPI001F37EEF7|nr:MULTISPECIES: metallophosphoesterase [Halobacterium]MDH5021190.1 metallophosphoesterase [Halobacterium rubrum]
MRFLVCNDLHLKPTASDYDVEAVQVSDDVDAAFVAGDLTHRDGEDDIALARRFIDRLATGAPVMYVPGNHDCTPMPAHVVDGLENATSGHDVVSECESVTVVGWGCERRSLDPILDQTAFPALDPRTEPRGERRYAADRTADAIEDALLEVVSDDTSARDAADTLDITPENRGAFLRSVTSVQAAYDHLASLVDAHTNVFLVTHLSPFNTSFDRHHSTGTREEDRESLHTGSIALKLVARTHDVFATICGHSHQFGYDTGDDADGAPHMLNLGFRGVGIVDVNPDAGVFSFADANPSM